MAPMLKRIDIAPALFQAAGQLIVHHLDESKDFGLYQCAVNDSDHIKSTTSNVKRIFGEYFCWNLIQVIEFRKNFKFRSINPKLESQKPQVNLFDIFYNVGERVNVSCDIAGYPSSIVLWSFTPCEDIDFGVFCDESKRITFNVNISWNQFCR